jgi:hypothetical protein
MPNTPNPTEPLANASSTSWLDNAPGGDIPFDQLFGTAPEASFSSANPPTEPQATTPAEPPATTPSAPEFVLKTRTGTVYKTIEDAARGVEEKDTLIQQLRDKLKTVTGSDPLRAPEPVAQPRSYLSDPTRFADDLAGAAKTGDAAKYRDTLVGLMEEYFGPAKPLISEFARSRATEAARAEYKDFDTFRSSENFNKTLERNPSLAYAIKVAEENIGFSHQLPELYRLVYESDLARRMPELVQAANKPQATAAPTTTTRPVLNTSSLTPAAPVTQRNEQELLRTSEGRKELLARFKAQGLEDVLF